MPIPNKKKKNFFFLEDIFLEDIFLEDIFFRRYCKKTFFSEKKR
jgi:hypothetical protein